MEIQNIQKAMEDNQIVYINNREVEILFVEPLTKTIKVLFLDSQKTTFVTKSSIKEKKKDNYSYLRDGPLLFEL